MVFLERRRNGKTVHRALKTAPRFFFGRKRHLYKSAVLDWFSGWDSPVANADRSRPPCCRFHIPVETGGTKVTSRVNKSFRRVLRDWQPRLKRRAMTVHTDSHVVAVNSLGHSGFDSNSLTVSKELTDDYCNSTV